MSATRRTKLFLCALIALSQRYKKPGSHVDMAPKFCAVAPIICGSSVLNVFHVTFLAPKTLRWTLHCKPEGRRFDSRWCHWNVSLT